MFLCVYELSRERSLSREILDISNSKVLFHRFALGWVGFLEAFFWCSRKPREPQKAIAKSQAAPTERRCLTDLCEIALGCFAVSRVFRRSLEIPTSHLSREKVGVSTSKLVHDAIDAQSPLEAGLLTCKGLGAWGAAMGPTPPIKRRPRAVLPNAVGFQRHTCRGKKGKQEKRKKRGGGKNRNNAGQVWATESCRARNV